MNIIVQAGGRGSRLRHHTWNKPKCLVSVRGKPILYHLFDAFPEAKFTIIADYLFSQLDTYLQSNDPNVKYSLIKASGSGTASGIKQAVNHLSEDESVLLIWSDIIVNNPTEWPKFKNTTVCVTDSFTCRWSLQNNNIVEQTSDSAGIPGIFWFENTELLNNVPTSGEFVRWLSQNLTIFDVEQIDDIEELGDFAAIEQGNDSLGFCRFFNRVDVQENTVTKQAIDSDYADLIKNEIDWYRSVKNLGFKRIPELLEEHPMIMQRIIGNHVWELNELTEREQRSLLTDILYTLQDLHCRDYTVADVDDVKSVYIDKTQNRVNQVSTLIPGFDLDSVTVNGVKCDNVFHENHNDQWLKILSAVSADYFSPIHGDPTFSNTIVDKNLKAWFIDPRGYFAKPQSIYGDPDYDFAKVYYSAVGGYDNFNRRKFKLYTDEKTAEIIMAEPKTANIAEIVFEEFFEERLTKIKILHGLIWLAFSGYAKDDIDSVIGSFYLGLYYLKQGLDRL